MRAACPATLLWSAPPAAIVTLSHPPAHARPVGQAYPSYGLARLLEVHASRDLTAAVRHELTSLLEAGRPPPGAAADEGLVRATATAARLLLRCPYLGPDLATLAQQTVRCGALPRHTHTYTHSVTTTAMATGTGAQHLTPTLGDCVGKRGRR
jgi:hypothetical protein